MKSNLKMAKKKLYIDMNGLHAYNCEFKEKVKIVIEKKMFLSKFTIFLENLF